MNPADEMAAKLESNGAVAGSDNKLDEQLRVSIEALLHPSPPRKPVEELDDLVSAISHHLDDETSERKAIYYRLAAIENEMTRRRGGFARYVAAICFAAAVILAWQSYGEATKQMIASRAPGLSEHFGWAKPPAGRDNTAVRASAPETAAPRAPAVVSLDPGQVQQIETDIAAVRQAVERHLADMRETVEQVAASQEQTAREITKLQAADEEILEKIPAPPAHRPAPTPARKPTPIAPPSSRTPIPPHPPPHP